MKDIDRIPLFDSVASPLREKLSEQLVFKRYSAREQIIDRKSSGNEVVFVIEGRVRVVIYSLSGREVAFDDIASGGYLGELAAIDSGLRSANVMSIDDSYLAFLPAQMFMQVLDETPSISIQVMRRLSKIIRQATTRIVDLSTLGANNRVHAELLRLSRIGNTEDENEAIIKPIPVHHEIASRVSTTRETVARVMNELARQGLLTREKDTIIINDIKCLEYMVNDVRGDI